MTVEEEDALEHDAIGFARRQMAAAHPELPDVVIPVVVGINVYTVQREGETTTDAARDRAIRAKHLVPVYLWQVPSFKLDQFNARPGSSPRIMSFLRLLPRIRVVNIGGGGDFVCSICSKKPWFGVQKASLPWCGHTFHSHCVVPWLEHNHLCPSCGSPAYDPDIRHLD